MNEFEFIDNIKSKYSLKQLGDDCAVLPKDGQTDQLVTADMLVEDVDFRLEWTKPEFLGHKALAVSLSDIAAMGGDPEWAMLSIAVPPKLWESDFLDKFYELYIFNRLCSRLQHWRRTESDSMLYLRLQLVLQMGCWLL